MNKVLKDIRMCTGCCACYNICPRAAIMMLEDEFGYLRAVVEDDKCINCGECKRVCPQLVVERLNRIEPQCFAVKASDEIRYKSSSGGVFTVISRWIIENGGTVYGAAFDDRYDVVHTKARNEQELSLLRKSKYVQSFIGHTLRDVEKELRLGKYVLFSGTPCQVAALYLFLGKKYEKLYTLDIVCHGVPSRKMFREDVISRYGFQDISGIDFRNKDYGWKCDIIDIITHNGKHQLRRDNCAYAYAFHSNLSLNDCCYDCKYAEIPRTGDFTCADCWDIEKYQKHMKDEKGVSLFLLNSFKAVKWFERKGNANFEYTLPLDINWVKNNNRFTALTKCHVGFERFRELYRATQNFEKAVNMIRENQYDIGVVGNWNNRTNYGSALTYYALYAALTQMGYSVLMIGPPMSVDKYPQQQPLFEKFPYPAYAVDRARKDVEEMRELNEICGKFVVGSDQLFQMNIFHMTGNIVDLHWVENRNIKIAYAASFGYDTISGSESERANMAYYLSKFDFFSVREESGIRICDKEYGIKAEWVLDPVFLPEIEEYEIFFSKDIEERGYIFVYILDPDSDKENALRVFSERVGKKIIAFSDAQYSKEKIEKLWNIQTLSGLKVEDFLSYIKNCDIFITDSFHGTCFSILFQKDFYAIVNPNRGSTRFHSLLKKFGLQSRMLNNVKELAGFDGNEINYNYVASILCQERVCCREWLRKALEDRKKQADTLDIIHSKLIEKEADVNKAISELSKKLDLYGQIIVAQQHIIKDMVNGMKIIEMPRELRLEYDEKDMIAVCENGVCLYKSGTDFMLKVPDTLECKFKFFFHVYSSDMSLNNEYGFVNFDFYFNDKADSFFLDSGYKGAVLHGIDFEFYKIRFGQYVNQTRLWTKIVEVK